MVDCNMGTNSYGYTLLESGHLVMDSLVSDFSSMFQHCSKGVYLIGYNTIVTNDHFRSSNMSVIDVIDGGFKILHNVFSHVSDGSYDNIAIHWVTEITVERGTE